MDCLSIICRLIFLSISLFSLSSALISCKSNNKDTDIWFIKKYPYTMGYSVYSAVDNSWSNKILGDINKESPFTETIDEIKAQKGEDEFQYHVWNDQFEEESFSAPFAHSKGILACDEESCILISHSFPVYPKISSALFDDQNKAYKAIKKSDWLEHLIPEKHDHHSFGQHMACFTLDNKNEVAWTTITTNLAVEGAVIGATTLSENSLQFFIPATGSKKILQYATIKQNQNECSHSSQLTTLKNIKLEIFSKYAGKDEAFAIDSWSYVATNIVKQELSVTFWGRGKTPGETFTDGENVKNIWIQKVPFSGVTENTADSDIIKRFPNIFNDKKDLLYIRSYEHGKYGFADNGYVCVGDSNRHVSQTERGSMTICFKHGDLHSELKSLVFVPTKEALEEYGTPIYAVPDEFSIDDKDPAKKVLFNVGNEKTDCMSNRKRTNIPFSYLGPVESYKRGGVIFCSIYNPITGAFKEDASLHVLKEENYQKCTIGKDLYKELKEDLRFNSGTSEDYREYKINRGVDKTLTFKCASYSYYVQYFDELNNNKKIEAPLCESCHPKRKKVERLTVKPKIKDGKEEIVVSKKESTNFAASDVRHLVVASFITSPKKGKVLQVLKSEPLVNKDLKASTINEVIKRQQKGRVVKVGDKEFLRLMPATEFDGIALNFDDDDENEDNENKNNKVQIVDPCNYKDEDKKDINNNSNKRRIAHLNSTITSAHGRIRGYN